MSRSHVSAWVTIGTYPFEHEAALVAGRLEQRGIATRILDAGLVGVAPHLSNAIGGVRLQVPKGDKDLVENLLAADAEEGFFDEGAWEEEDEEETEAGARADAGGAEAVTSGNRLAAKALFAAVLGISFAPLVGTFFSGATLFELRRGGGEGMSGTGKLMAAGALLIDLVVVALVIAFCSRGLLR